MRHPLPPLAIRRRRVLPVFAALPLLAASLLQVGPAQARGAPPFAPPAHLAAKGGPSLRVPAALSAAASFVVHTTVDSSSCAGTILSLRCAISAANASTATGAKTISFAIPAGSPGCTVQTIQGKSVSVCTLQPTRDLPPVSANNVTINGYSQTGAAGNINAIGAGDNAILTIQLDGSKDSAANQGLDLGGVGDVVQGLSVTGFARAQSGVEGIVLDGGGDIVQGDFIGLTPSGAAAPNYNGLPVLGGFSTTPPATDLIGGTGAAARNVISGNLDYGVEVEAAATIQGNLIGTNPAGAAAIGNGQAGINLDGNNQRFNVTIGGTSASARNVISGNGTAYPSPGVFLAGDRGTVIAGNYIGTNATGTAALPNATDGILVLSSQGETIGGTASGAGNLISGNQGNGIDLSGVSNATVEGNWIGISSAGTKLGNVGNGVSVHGDPPGNGSSRDTIGLPGAGNTIMDNGGNGVLVSPPSTVGIAVRGNSIANNPLGISLSGEYPSSCLNGPGPGPNDYFPCPVIAFASTGTVRGIATPGSTVDVYTAQPSSGDQGHGEGVTYLGTATAQGNGDWTLTLRSGQAASGQVLTAAAAGIGPSTTAPETSEFAADVTVTAQVKPAVFVANGGNNTVTDYALGGNGNVGPLGMFTGSNGLNAPAAVVLNPAGDLFVANSGNSSITEYAPGVSGNTALIATLAGSNTGLSSPYAVALDAFGRLYVANEPANTITVYPSGANGNIVPLATISGADTGLSGPDALTVDANGNLWVANSGNNSLTEYAAGASGDAKPIAAIAGSATSLNRPAGLAQDAKGDLLVANQFGESVTAYPAGSNGNVFPSVTIAGSSTGLDFPIGIDVDTAGNIYVANQFGASITEFAPTASGNATPLATIGGSSTGLSSPSGLAVAPPLSVLTATLPKAIVGQHYAAVLQAGEGRGPYTWALVKGTLPAGLHLRSVGVIAGTPTAKGRRHVTVRVTDSTHPAMTAERTLTVAVTG